MKNEEASFCMFRGLPLATREQSQDSDPKLLPALHRGLCSVSAGNPFPSGFRKLFPKPLRNSDPQSSRRGRG